VAGVAGWPGPFGFAGVAGVAGLPWLPWLLLSSFAILFLLLTFISWRAGVVAVAVGVRDFAVAIVNHELRVLVLADRPPELDGVLFCFGVDGSPLGSIALDIPPTGGVGNHMVFGSLHGGVILL
jgi:hypothetical protein